MTTSKKIDSNLLIQPHASSFTKKMGYLVGRVWSLCSFFLSELIRRVSFISTPRFAKKQEIEKDKIAGIAKKPTVITKDPTPINSIKPIPTSLLSESSLRLNSLTTQRVEEKKFEEEKIEGPEIEIDLQKLMQAPPLLESVEPVKTMEEIKDSPLDSNQGGIPTQICQKEQLATKINVQENTNLESQTKNTQGRKFSEFIKNRRKNKTTPHGSVPSTKPNSQSLPVNLPPSSSLKNESVEAPLMEPILFENDGKGDCLLHSILKGLEMQHPDLLNYQENGKLVPYTAQKLREIAVNFSRQHIGTYDSEWFERALGYLESDKKEHNDDEIDFVQSAMKVETDKIEEDFKNKKILKRLYDLRIKNLKQKYTKIIDNLEKNIFVESNEEYLNRLEKPGFCCSSLHLFSLSILLNIPLMVHHAKGLKGHDIETFNEANSTKAPIHLYRTHMHFRYLLFPN